MVVGFAYPSFASLAFAVLLSYAIFVHAVSVDTGKYLPIVSWFTLFHAPDIDLAYCSDNAWFWNHTVFWVIVQFICGNVMIVLMAVQFLPLFKLELPEHYLKFGVAVFSLY